MNTSMMTPPAEPERWGLTPLPGVRYNWGARAIYEEGGPALLWDRQSFVGGTDDERKALKSWIDGKALPYLRAWLADGTDFPLKSEDREVLVYGDGFVMRANPRASYGYVYLSAEPSDLRCEPLKPYRECFVVNDTKSSCRACGASPFRNHAEECAAKPRVIARQRRQGGPRQPQPVRFKPMRRW